MKDLGTVPGYVNAGAFAINASGQAVGQAWNTSGPVVAALWENGATPVDLNLLLDPSSNHVNLHLFYAYVIADNGVILAFGNLPNGDLRIAELVPSGYCNIQCEATLSTSASIPLATPQVNQKPIPGKGVGWQVRPFLPR